MLFCNSLVLCHLFMGKNKAFKRLTLETKYTSCICFNPQTIVIILREMYVLQTLPHCIQTQGGIYSCSINAGSFKIKIL